MVGVGINIPNFGSAAEVDTVRRAFVRAEESGFDLAMASDHVAVTEDVARSYPPPFLESFALLSWAAGVTERIALGTTVTLLPLRHPLLLAASVETIERLSGRDFVLGVGVGWAAQEYDALGVDFARRGSTTDQHLAVLARRRTNGNTDGVHSGHPRAQLWIGGNGRAALDRTARFGDAWHPLGVTLSDVREKVVTLHDADSDAAFAPRIKLNAGTEPIPDRSRHIGSGTWDQIEADLNALAQLGASHVVLDPDVPDVRAGADPWPRLMRAAAMLRSRAQN